MEGANSQAEEDLASFVAGKIDPAAFPHREHLRLAYEMLARHPFADVVSHFSRGLKKLAAKSERPKLYHDTITVAFLALIAERRAQARCNDWKSFIAENNDLLDKRCLERWYDPARLKSDVARQNFILPPPARAAFLANHGPLEETCARSGAPSLRIVTTAIMAYAVVYALLIVWASALTVWKAYGHNTSLVWLGSTEIVGAVFFLFNRTRLAGVALLLTVFSIATVAEIVSGGLPTRFIIYSASALLVWILLGWLKTETKDSRSA